MDEKSLEVLEQYDLDVIRTRKGRSVYFAETSRGLHMLKECHSSQERLEKLWQLANALENVVFFQTDLPVKNKEGVFLSKDAEGRTYLLKSWKEGRECDPHNDLDLCRAMEGLAIFHTVSRGTWKFEDLREREKYVGANLTEELQKRTRELKKVQTFIRRKQKKNAFEDCYLSLVPEFLEEASEITLRLQESSYERLRAQAVETGNICHGEYNQHNILFDRTGMLLTNFEHAHLDIPCMDVALFLRKVMEKQGWKIIQGETLLKAYEVVRPMEPSERRILGLCLSYPEKLWKLANHYYHTNKVWIPAKDLEKLKVFAKQQKERQRFVQKVILS